MDPSRITLRPFRLTDADDLLKWAGDDRVTRTIRWKTLTSKEEALSFIKEVCIPHPWRLAICVDDRSIGFLWMMLEPLGDGGGGAWSAEIGYAIAVEYWGKGIATRVVKMATSLLFQHLPGVVRVEAYADVENGASHRVLEKGGFVKEGVLSSNRVVENAARFLEDSVLGKYACPKANIKGFVVYSLIRKNKQPIVERVFDSSSSYDTVIVN